MNLEKSETPKHIAAQSLLQLQPEFLTPKT